MAEPHSTAVTVAAISGISLVAGTVFGLEMSALVFGLFGGLAALKLEDASTRGGKPRGWWQKITTAALGTVAAAALAPLLGGLGHQLLQRLEFNAQPGAMLPAVAFAVGAGAEVLLREMLRAAVNRLRQVGGIAKGDAS